MTLKEKFKEVLINPIWQMTMIDKQMEIADEFAIGFADWFVLNYTEEVFYDDDYTKNKLEIYKKENKL